MKKFIFLFNKKNYRVSEDKNITEKEINILEKKGYDKEWIEAHNKSDAIKKFKEKTQVDLDNLDEFVKSATFYTIIESLIVGLMK